MAQTVGEELLRDVLFAVGVLKGQVELVLLLQHVKALSVFPQASQVATCSIDVHLKGSPVFDVQEDVGKVGCAVYLNMLSKPFCII